MDREKKNFRSRFEKEMNLFFQIVSQDKEDEQNKLIYSI